MRVIAIIAAFNEADIIGPVIGDLLDQGVLVYLIDHGSTDGTVAAAQPFSGKGLLGVERFPPAGHRENDTFTWSALLRRKEVLAADLDGEWFLHQDADEFRESPWRGVRLVEAIECVDSAGYNAIDFEVLNFYPSDNTVCGGEDPRPVIRRCAPSRAWDRVQVKCWRRQASAVDLVSSGGHDVQFAGRRVFPLRFLTRHYPIRSQAHGARKVFGERSARFDPQERALGWHVQYDELRPDHDFLARAQSLTEYDAERVRLQLFLRHRGVEELESSLRERQAAIAVAEAKAEALQAQVAALTNDIVSLNDRLLEAVIDRDRLALERDRLDQRLVDSECRVETLNGRLAELEEKEQDSRKRIARLEESSRWTWTTSLRVIARWLGLPTR